MFKNNNLFLGIAYGLIAPVIAWLIFAVLLKNEVVISNKPAVPYLIAIALNLLVLRFAARALLDKTAYGIMIATFVCTLLIFIFKVYR